MLALRCMGPGLVPLVPFGHSRRRDDVGGADLPPASSARPRSSLPLPLGTGAAPRSADGPDLPAASAAAEEPVAAVGLEPRHTRAARHLQPLQDLARTRVDPPHITLLAFPGAVPQLAVDPGDAGDDAVGVDGTEDGACVGSDLMDPPAPVLPNPERAFGPRKPRVATAAGRRKRREHAPCLGIDLLDAVLGDLEQVLAVESRSGVRGDIDRAHGLSALRIEGVELVTGREPDVPTVERHAMHLVGTRKGAILTEDFGWGCFHGATLVARQRTGE